MPVPILMPGRRWAVTTYLVVVSLLCYPTFSVAIKGGMNAMFFMLAGCSLYLLYVNRLGGERTKLDRSTRIYIMAMILPALAILANQLSLKAFDPHPYDGASRFLLAPLIYIALANWRNNIAAVLEIAFPIGAISSLVMAEVTPTRDDRAVTYFLSAIHFGDLALLMGFLSLFSINWIRRDPRWVWSVKSAGFAIGIYTAILSGTRGGWAAIPVLIALWFFWGGREHQKQLRFHTLLYMVLTVFVAGYFLSGLVGHRLDLVISNLQEYMAGRVNSGTAARLELWKASYYMFTEQPFFGVGPDGFKQMLVTLHDRGIINELVVIEGTAEAHSEIAGNMARYGLMGLVSILMLYIAPIWGFKKFVYADDRMAAIASRMGICVAVSFFIFGLTVETFDIKMVAAFYSMTIAVLLAIATNKHAASTQ